MNLQTETIKNSLKEGHPLHTLISEHEFILNFLQELEDLNSFFQKASSVGNNEQDAQYIGRTARYNSEEIQKLNDIAEHLIGAEPHHQREEEVLFPEIEKRGILGPPEVMRQEHEKLREYKNLLKNLVSRFAQKKKELKNLAENSDKVNSEDFKKKLNEISEILVLTLREHISKENDIFYPMALQVIPEENLWQEIKKRCDKIGYCCFTPSI